MTNAPCANAPSLRYDGSRRAQATEREENEAGERGASFCLIPDSKASKTAPKQPQRRLTANPALGVNESK